MAKKIKVKQIDGAQNTITPGPGIAVLNNGVVTEVSISQPYLDKIQLGEWAYTWGNHATAGYLKQADLNGYATQSWVTSQGYATTTQLVNYLPLAGGSMTGAAKINFGTPLASSYSLFYTQDATPVKGYGIWLGQNLTTNANGDFIQNRGSLGSLGFSVNNHKNFSFNMASPSGTDGSVITLTEVASISKIGLITANEGFKKGSGTNTRVLLDGGGDKLLSDFALASNLGNYLPLAGGTMSGMINLSAVSTTGIHRDMTGGTTGGWVRNMTKLTNGTTVNEFGYYGSTTNTYYGYIGSAYNVKSALRWSTDTNQYVGLGLSGTEIPAYNLEVAGTIRFRNFTNGLLRVDASGVVGVDTNSYALLSQVYTQSQALGLFVGLNGVQTIADTKTFTSSPIVPNATLNTHAVNLGQINTLLGGYATTTALNNYYQSGNVNIPVKNGDYRVFPYGDAATTFDLDTITEYGFYKNMTNNTNANSPKTGYWYVENLCYGTSGNLTQYAHPYRVSDGKWMRSKFQGSWTPWVEFVHSGNLDSYASNLGYIKSSAVNTQLGNYVTLGSVQTITATKTFTIAPIVPNGTLAGHTVNLGQMQSYVTSQGFITTETDPTVPSHVKAISTADISSWNGKYTFPNGGNTSQYINGLGQLATFPTIPTVNNGSFVVQGVGALTGAGTTSANASANTTATLDLTTATKNEIAQGVDAYNIIQNSNFATNNGYDYIPTGGSQTIQPTATKTTVAIQGSNVTITLQDGVNDGDECSITTCGGQQYYVNGSIIDMCGNTTHEAQTSTLWWWHQKDNVWYQAI